MVAAVAALLGFKMASASDPIEDTTARPQSSVLRNAVEMLEEGRRTSRSDTFGDEEFRGGRLRLHEAIAGADNGGVGPGVAPATALSAGLKVDVDAPPKGFPRVLDHLVDQVIRGSNLSPEELG